MMNVHVGARYVTDCGVILKGWVHGHFVGGSLSRYICGPPLKFEGQAAPRSTPMVM
jgi:hypothetical protein